MLPGTWRVTRPEAAGQSTACAGEINFVENGDETSVSCGANDTVTFFENGAFTGTSAGGGACAGTWQFSGDTLTVNITTPSMLAATELVSTDSEK
ncbi:MAG: lipocalin family protein [Akkermansiaceae bacterium]|nr:lipocalin family protein [Armatimonadota bacterium]